MSFHLRVVPFLLLVSICFTACDVPDISDFSEQSSEMTSGIRKEVKETQSILQEQVDDIDSYDKKNQELVKKNLAEYKKAMKPTLQTLDSLDAYLEALNALSQANKKSAENSKAAVSAVGNLVSSVATLPIFPAGSSFKVGDSAIRIATGLLALEEQFRTAKNFKTRVNLAADIVEGRYVEVTKTSIVNGESKPTKELKKICGPSNKKDIEDANEALASHIAAIQNDPSLSDRAKESLIKNWRESSEEQVRNFGCGAIDLLKFTLEDLKVITNNALPLAYSNYKQKNELTLSFYDSIVGNDARVQNELRFILLYKQALGILRDRYPGSKPPVDTIEPVRRRLNNVFQLDGSLKETVIESLDRCRRVTPERCGAMKDFLRYTPDQIKTLIYPNVSLEQWEYATALFETDLDTRAGVLFEQNAKYLADLGRLKESYGKVTADLAAIKDKQEQMNKLIDTSEEALDAWTEAHANLRVAVNTKKPLPVARLKSKVKEIWALFEPAKG